MAEEVAVPWIVVVSAGALGPAPIVGRAAKEAGYKSVLLHDDADRHKATDELLQVYDEVIYTAEIDRQTIQKIAVETRQRGSLNAVMSCTDLSMINAANVAKEFGLPHPPLEALALSCNKYEGRLAEQAAGLDTPAFQLLPVGISQAELLNAVNKVPFPALIKPNAGTSSEFTTVVNSFEELERAYHEAQESIIDPYTSKPGAPMLLEEYVFGDEYTVELMIEKGEITRVVAAQKIGLPHELVNPSITVCPPYNPAHEEVVWRTVEHALEKVYLFDDCLINFDIKNEPTRCVLLDVNAGRFGGRRMDIFAEKNGFDLGKEMVSLWTATPNTGRKRKPRSEFRGRLARIPLFPEQEGPGTLARFDGREAISNDPRVEHAATSFAVGDHIYRRPALMLVFARLSKEETIADAIKLRDRLTNMLDTTIKRSPQYPANAQNHVTKVRTPVPNKEPLTSRGQHPM